MGTAGKIAIFIAPIIFILGIFQYNGFGIFYAPSGAKVLSIFSSYEGIEYINDMAKIARMANLQTVVDAQNITDIFAFFKVIGDFFGLVVAWIGTIGTIMFLPIYTIGWAIANLINITLMTPGNEEATEAVSQLLSNSIKMLKSYN